MVELLSEEGMKLSVDNEMRKLVGVRLFKEKAGYFKKHHWVDRAKDLMLTLLFIIPAIPIVVFITPLVLVFNGRPILYKGERFGWNKRIFVMYKFRTLPKDFEANHRATLVSSIPKYRLPWFSRFLRDTRLDELPQLYNVLKGDMDLIGPRPERPCVYDELCKKIHNYDKRFQVRPGLVGYSQLFTPHSTPKRIRSAIDNRATKYKKGVSEFIILALAVYAAVSTCTKVLFRAILNTAILGKTFKRYNEKRGLDRIRLKNGRVGLAHDEGFSRGFAEEIITCGILYDINEEYFRIDSNEKIDHTQSQYVITATIKRRFPNMVFIPEKKSAYCHGNICRSYENLNKKYSYSYVVKYKPVTNLNQYFVDQYFLKKGMMRYVF